MGELATRRFNDAKGWIAYLDVYGFTSLIHAQDNTEIADRLLSLHESTAAELRKADYHQFFSDSIFVYASDEESDETGSESSFQLVMDAVRSLIKHSFAADLFLRGSLAYGSITILPNIIIGKPLIRAYRQEQALRYPIVVVPEIELESGGIPLALPVMEIETKRGLISAAAVVPHRRSRVLDAAVEKARETAKHGPDEVALAWKHYISLLEQLGYGRKGRTTR